ncbi:SdpI family protein [Halobacteria archaeon AArc-m2/3/4]|uniref:SdpI family protein n=1 Tax=Natronoglomus mannanivorans TaxID=2979990 RepID=A0ABT2QJH2_9EURY|nr:SdpI family protein [Halobacteria archaeon AArc-m2/3/4]
MNTRHRFALAGGFVALSAILSVIAAPELPDQMVSNWTAAGEPSGTMSKPLALGLVPVLTAGLLGVFAAIPRIDPLRANIAEFRLYYDWFVVIFAAYLFLIHAGIIAFNLGYEFDFLYLILFGVAGLFYYCGIVLSHAKQNWFVGIRTPWTLSNEEVWNRTHALGGKLFKLTAILAVIGLLFGEYALYFFLIPAVATAAITVVYSYYLYEQIERDDFSLPDSE